MQLNDQLLSQIEQALLSLTAPNTTIVRQGEKYLKEFMKNQMSILGFLTHIQRSQQVAVRQLAAVLLRMNINKHWPNLSKELQENLKATLINLLMQEVHKLPRRAIATCPGGESGEQRGSSSSWRYYLPVALEENMVA